MATFLNLTNELLRELNEVILTSSNFSSAVGVQQHAKDSVNRAYLDIVNEEPQWPFLATAESGATDPMYGNAYIETVAGTRWYELKPTSSSITTDYGSVDWDNFMLTTVGVSNEAAPYTIKNLKYTTTEEWKDYLRISENQDDANTTQYGVPSRVIRSPDARNFGLSPIPDQVYRIWFFAWDLPTELDVYGDTIVFPDIYRTVLLARARYYIWQFKDNPQAAAFALDDYKKGIRMMRSTLLEPTPSYFKDDRIGFI
jgi:hypothetical protein|tara:strand:- start:2622 stop:3389 length:768 start_codon:yes stop_codon:yes gene_type:complete